MSINTIWKNFNTPQAGAGSIIKIINDISQSVGEEVRVVTHPDAEGYMIRSRKDGEFIWEIYEGTYQFWDQKHFHLWVEVPEKIRRKGIGTKLYELWEAFWREIPEEEFTRDRGQVDFFQRLGYQPVSLIRDCNGEEEEIDGPVSYQHIWKGYSLRMIMEK